MADRHFPIATGHFYHIFNRGVAKQPTFLSKKDYEQAILALSYYRFSNVPIKLSRFKEISLEEKTKLMLSLEKDNDNLVRIVGFVLMPNHFHFLLYQNKDKGIATFIAKFSNSYTKYFNTKQDRVGPIFQGVYKAVKVDTDEQLVHLSRYIHLNPVVSSLITKEEIFNYPWSSLPHFVKDYSTLVYVEPILSLFKNKSEYNKFLLDQISYAKQLELIKHLTLE